MNQFLIGIALTAIASGATAVEFMDKTEIEFQGRELLVYQGQCTQGDFTIQKVSQGYQFIGPKGIGLASCPQKAAQQACGIVELEG